MTEDEKTLVALEEKLGLVPRRELKQQLQMVERDLVQASQMFNSFVNDPAQWSARHMNLLTKRTIDGIISKNFGE